MKAALDKKGDEIVLTPLVDKKKFISELKGCATTRSGVKKLKKIWGMKHVHD